MLVVQFGALSTRQTCCRSQGRKGVRHALRAIALEQFYLRACVLRCRSSAMSGDIKHQLGVPRLSNPLLLATAPTCPPSQWCWCWGWLRRWLRCTALSLAPAPPCSAWSSSVPSTPHSHSPSSFRRSAVKHTHNIYHSSTK